jgi:hypothetical protein
MFKAGTYFLQELSLHRQDCSCAGRAERARVLVGTVWCCNNV